MTWLDLYNMLHQKANDIKNLDGELWNRTVMVHNAETGDEYVCDTWEIDQRMVLVFNDSQGE